MFRALIAIAAVVGASQADAAATNYPPPKSDKAAGSWPIERNGIVRYQRRGDPNSPRYINAVTGPKFDVRSFDGVVADLVKDSGVRFATPVRFERIEAWNSFDKDVRVALVATSVNNAPGVMFLVVNKAKNSPDFYFSAIEMRCETYAAWGGIAHMIVMGGWVPSIDVFPLARRRQIAAAPPAAQVRLYEEAVNKQYMAMAQGFLMANQAQTMLRMRELNYDLLLGNNIGNPTIGGN